MSVAASLVLYLSFFLPAVFFAVSFAIPKKGWRLALYAAAMASLLLSCAFLFASKAKEDLFSWREFGKVAFWFCAPSLGAGIVLLLLRRFAKIPDYVFRKILHLCVIGASCAFVFATDSFCSSFAFALLLFVLFAAFLPLAEKCPFYSHLLVEKYPHEVYRDILLYFYVLLIGMAYFWGLFAQEPYVALSPILIWGLGDAAAALVGTKWGKHPWKLPFAAEHKSIEGSLAMLVVSFLVGGVLLVVSQRLCFAEQFPFAFAILAPLGIAVLCAFIEMITRKDLDNFTVSLAATLCWMLFFL